VQWAATLGAIRRRSIPTLTYPIKLLESIKDESIGKGKGVKRKRENTSPIVKRERIRGIEVFTQDVEGETDS